MATLNPMHCEHDWTHVRWFLIGRFTGRDDGWLNYDHVLHEWCRCRLCGIEMLEEQPAETVSEADDEDETRA